MEVFLLACDSPRSQDMVLNAQIHAASLRTIEPKPVPKWPQPPRHQQELDWIPQPVDQRMLHQWQAHHIDNTTMDQNKDTMAKRFCLFVNAIRP